MKNFPLARSKQLTIQESGDELLVYDQADDQAHCLNSLAGAVWKMCNGRTSTSEMASVVCRTLKIPADVQVVELALQELAQCNLLENAVKPNAGEKLYTRRYLAGRLAGASAAAIVLGSLVFTARARGQARPSAKTTTTTLAPVVK